MSFSRIFSHLHTSEVNEQLRLRITLTKSNKATIWNYNLQHKQVSFWGKHKGCKYFASQLSQHTTAKETAESRPNKTLTHDHTNSLHSVNKLKVIDGHMKTDWVRAELCICDSLTAHQYRLCSSSPDGSIVMQSKLVCHWARPSLLQCHLFHFPRTVNFLWASGLITVITPVFQEHYCSAFGQRVCHVQSGVIDKV